MRKINHRITEGGRNLKDQRVSTSLPWAETPSCKTRLFRELRFTDRLYLYSSLTSLLKGNQLKAKWEKKGIIPRWQPKWAFCSLLTTWFTSKRVGMVLSLMYISFCEYLLFMVMHIYQFLIYSNHFLSTTEYYLYEDTGDILVLGILGNTSFRKLWEPFHNLMWHHALGFCIIVKFQPQFALIFQKMDCFLKSIFELLRNALQTTTLWLTTKLEIESLSNIIF